MLDTVVIKPVINYVGKGVFPEMVIIEVIHRYVYSLLLEKRRNMSNHKIMPGYREVCRFIVLNVGYPVLLGFLVVFFNNFSNVLNDPKPLFNRAYLFIYTPEH